MASNARKLVPSQSQTPTRRTPNENTTINGLSSRGTSQSPGPPSTGANSGQERISSSRSSPAPMSARAAARKPVARANTGLGGASKSTDKDIEDLRAEHAQLVEDLRLQVQRAETASDHYQKELEILQQRLHEVVGERDTLEDQISQSHTDVQAVHQEAKDLKRKKSQLEHAHEAEKAMMLKEREEQANKEQELQGIIQRLNETIRQKGLLAHVDADHSALSRSASFRSRKSPELEPGQFSPSAQLERSPSRNNSTLLLQKDKMIESLRLELAEVQIKLAEIEHMGDGSLQEVEKQLLEARMANARLMEDNESFQLLLSEKTLKGDFMQECRPQTASGMGTLAEELELASGGGEGESSEAYKRLETELKASRDSNKALTLYIDKIIGRLLQHDGFEHIIHDKDEPAGPSVKPTDKALPPPPPDEQVPSLLERAKSVVSGRSGRPTPRARPMSYMPTSAPSIAPDTGPTAHENPETAPSIPLSKGHRRSRSDQAAEIAAAGGVTTANQTRRGSPLRTSSGERPNPVAAAAAMSGSMSPTTTISSSPANRLPVAMPGNPNTSNSRTPSGSILPSAANRSSRANSVLSEQSGDAQSMDTSSPPREKAGGGSGANAPIGAVMKQNQLRPLKLVRENSVLEDEEAAAAARKRANRGSWVPAWFNRAGFGEGEPLRPPG